MKITPSIPKGMRDFDAQTLYKRQYIQNIIKHVYEMFGFEPIETPAQEKLQVLTGKYGEEGDRLLFKVLNSGDYLSKVPTDVYESKKSNQLTEYISEKGLRYDLTVPFARYVAQHRNDITFPFRRYQMQSVWRADRPQKGRYRQFLQCDADVIGTKSLIAEADFIRIYDFVFRKLQIPNVVIKINNRKILAGISEVIGSPDKMIEMTTAIDKLDKIGKDGVEEELRQAGFSNEQVSQISHVIDFSSSENKLDFMQEFLSQSKIGTEGVHELKTIFSMINQSTIADNFVEFDVSLARGLAYYTGTIFEVIVQNTQFGSVSGGGRYDNLTSIFGLDDVSGVGISFGLDRVYDVMEQLNLWPESLINYKTPTRVLVTYMDEEHRPHISDFVEKLRFNGIPTEMYPEPVKLSKQFKYANQKGIPHVVVIGSEEIESGKYQVKFMKSGEQQSLAPAYIINALKPR